MTQIKEALRDFNPWWLGKFTVAFKERDLYAHIQKFLSLPQILAFTGLRRVGKTTLLLKIVADSIANGFDPKNIIYFSFDEFKTIDIRSVIKEYEEVLETDFTKGQYILLLDEMQKLKGWEEQVKSMYDVFGKRVKIIISGSESLFIKKKAKETLAGRLFEFTVDLLTFNEFLSFKEIKWTPINLHERELIRLFHEFTLTLGFPELVHINDREIMKKYINEGIVKKVIYQDIPKLFEIKNITVIESLLNIFMEEPGQIIDLAELAKELKISRQTLANYLTYLEDSFLLRKVYNFSRNKRKVERKLKKYYPTIISPHLLYKEDVTSKSKVFEWLIVNQLKAEFFWRDPYKHEVDIVIVDKEIVPIEVKYGKIEVDGLVAFMNKFHVGKGIVMSYKDEEERTVDTKTIVIVPAYKYLLRTSAQG